MVKLNINREDLCIPENINSDVNSKKLLNYHFELYNEHTHNIKKIVSDIISSVSNLNKIKKEIITQDKFLKQLEQIELERKSLYKKRDNYFTSKKFTTPDQETFAEDSLIRQNLNNDKNYIYMGNMSNIVFDFSCINNNSRFAEAILRQTKNSVNNIKLTDKQIDTLKDLAYSMVNPEYEEMIDDLDIIEEELALNKHSIKDHMSCLLEGLL